MNPKFREYLRKLPDAEVMAIRERELKLYPDKLYELQLRKVEIKAEIKAAKVEIKAEIKAAKSKTEGRRWRIEIAWGVVAAALTAPAVLMALVAISTRIFRS